MKESQPQNEWSTAIKGVKDDIRERWLPDITMTVLSSALGGVIGYFMSTTKGIIIGAAIGLTVAIWIIAYLMIQHIPPKADSDKTDKVESQQNVAPETKEIPALSDATNLILSSEPSTAGEWLYILAVTGKEKDAVDYARKIPDPIRRSETLAFVAQGLSRVSKISDANAVATLAVEAEDQVYKSGLMRLRPPALVPITKALVDVGRMNEAIECARRYKASTDFPWSLYRSAKGLKCAGKRDDAKKIAYEALEAVNKMKESYIQPIALIEAIRLLACLGESEKALKITRRMTDPVQQNQAFIAIAKEVFQLGDGDKARQVVAEALSKERKSSKSQVRTQALAMVALGLMAMGENERAQETAIEAKNSVPVTSDSIIRFSILLMLSRAFTKLGRINEANEFINEAVSTARLIDRVDLRASHLTDAARTLIRLGRRNEASEVLNQALNSAKQIPSDVLRSSAMLNIARARAKCGLFHSALEIINLCSSSDHKLVASVAIARESAIQNNPSLSALFEKDEEEKDWLYELDFSCS